MPLIPLKWLHGWAVCGVLTTAVATAQERFEPRPPGVASVPQGEPAASDFMDRLLAGRDAETTPTAEVLRLVSYDDRRAPWLLAHGTDRKLHATRAASTAADWWVTPAGGGMVRLQTYDNGRVYAMASQRGGHLGLLPLAQDPRQLWRVTGMGRGAHRFVLENVHAPGSCLAHLGGGRLALQPIDFAAAQLWMALAAPSSQPYQPFYRTVTREIHANPQLPAAQLELRNTHRYALLVLLGDSRRGAGFEQIRIEPQSAVTITLERDSGGTIVETYELRSPLGDWERQQLVTAIPPAAYYDLSVYEEHLQSIAIDRTGKSPNRIEDVNYVPKSLGWLPLPAGSSLPAVGQVDVYRRAKLANNPGAVRRLDREQPAEPPPADRLESLLNELQPRERRQF
ncbi:MAG: hypothetical protein KDA45_03170 [Planctomycetales bacterium]|nr:hypothetical protein [Planctomycetales bacterium]